MVFLFSRASGRHTNWKELQEQGGKIVSMSKAHAHSYGGRVDRGLGQSHRLNISLRRHRKIKFTNQIFLNRLK